MSPLEEILRVFQGILMKDGYDAVWDTRLPDTPGLTILLSLREDREELVFTEMHLVSLLEDINLLQIYTTLLGELSQEAMAELSRAVPLWNLKHVIGAVNLYPEGAQLYHRYCLMLPAGLPAEQAARMAQETFGLILSQLRRLRPGALAIAGGVPLEEVFAEST